MGRRPSETVRKLRELALRLDSQGLTSAAIGQQVGRSDSTVRGWLRQLRGRRPRYSDLILPLSTGGAAADAIAGSVGCSERRVYQVLQENHGKRRSRRTTADLVDLFLVCPHRYKQERFCWSIPFGWDLLRRCADEIDRNATTGLASAVSAVDLFEYQLPRRRKVVLRCKTRCLLTQGVNIEGAANRILGKLSITLQSLRKSLALGADCPECQAECLRQGAWLQVYFGHTLKGRRQFAKSEKAFQKGQEAFSDALQFYRSIEGYGHSLHRNGVASCLYGRSVLLWHRGNYADGERDARSALNALNPATSPGLVVPANHTLAVHLLKLGSRDRLVEARRTVTGLLERFPSDSEPSLPRAKTKWLAGLLSEEDAAGEALALFYEAKEELVACEAAREVVVLMADISRVERLNASALRRLIADLGLRSGAATVTLPPWLKPVFHHLEALLTATREPAEVQRSILGVRRDAGGDSVMPFVLETVMA